MKKIFVSIFVLLVCIFSLPFFVAKADAAVGINKQINFQGKLVDGTGLNVADSTYTVVFSLYSVSSGGSAIWTESDSVTTTGGIFQVALGAVTALPDSVYFNSDSLYLGIKVNTDAEMTPRVRFTAVPYAFNAGALDGVVATQSATGFNLQGGTSSTSTLAVTTSGSVLTFQPGVAEGLTLQSNGANGLTIDTGGAGAVSIGNTNATSLVFGSTGHNPTFAFNGTGLTTLGGNVQVNGNNIQDSGATTRLTLGASTTLTNTTTVLSGTTTVTASSLGTLTTASSLSMGSTSSLTFSGTATLIGGTAAGSSLTLESTSGAGTSDFIAFKVGSQIEQMRIDTGGNVGIGTNFATRPAQAQFDVRSDLGTLPIASLSGTTSFAGLVVNNSGVGDLLTASSAGITRYRMTNNGSTLFQGDTLTSIGSLGNNAAGVSETNQSAVVNAIGDEGSLVPNAGFESAITANKTTNVASGPVADGWIATATMSAAVTRIATDSAKGTSSVMMKLNASQSTSISSVCIPLTLRVSGIYNLNFYANSLSASPVIRGFIDGYTTKANCQSNTTGTPYMQGNPTAATAGWKTYGGATAITTTANTNTWGRVRISVNCPASCATGTTVNVDGIRLIETSNAVGVDYAENYPADPGDVPQPGDVVSIEASNGASLVAKTKVAMDQSTIGIVSTQPGYVLDDGTMSDPKVPVALAGRVPVKVATTNGPIHVGDYLTSSTIPGVAVKAVSAGPVIGTAMEDDTDPDTSHISEITLFIKNTYYNGSVSNDTGLLLSSGGDASVLLALLQGTQSASDSALTALATNGVANGLNVLVSHIAQVLGASASALITSPASDAASFVDTSLQGLTINDYATVSGDLRVKGNSLIEGILHVADTLFANNFIANGVSEFFGTVVFHTGVTFENTPTFSSDTAGFAVIKKGSDHVSVSFTKAYEQVPVVNASITFNPVTPTPGEPTDALQQRQSELEKALLLDNIRFVVTKRTVNGFSILLDKPAGEDISFSWLALAVQNPAIFQSDGTNQQIPSPTSAISPSPLDTIMPTNSATTSAGF